MVLTKLKECPQGLWLGNLGYSKDGVCYYMSEYVRDKILGVDVKTFKDVVEAAKKAVPDHIIKAGKAKNSIARGGKAISQDEYDDALANLAANKVYRVGMWVNTIGKWPALDISQNHEAVVITGAASEVVFFEPNFGFYHAKQDLTTLLDVFKEAVNSLYDPVGYFAMNFHFQVERSIA
jgi:hypothetical protein